jgi:hypothetical protein
MSRNEQAMTTGTTTPMDGWNTIPWKKIEKNVFKLQKRIYQASKVHITNAKLLRSRVHGKRASTVLKRRWDG